MDVRNDTTTGDGRLDERVKLLVTTDGKLKVARRDALDLKVLGGVARKLENLSSEVLEDGNQTAAVAPTRCTSSTPSGSGEYGQPGTGARRLERDCASSWTRGPCLLASLSSFSSLPDMFAVSLLLNRSAVVAQKTRA